MSGSGCEAHWICAICLMYPRFSGLLICKPYLAIANCDRTGVHIQSDDPWRERFSKCHNTLQRITLKEYYSVVLCLFFFNLESSKSGITQVAFAECFILFTDEIQLSQYVTIKH